MIGVKIFHVVFYFFFVVGKCHAAEQGGDSLVCVFLGGEGTLQIKHPFNQLFAPKSGFPTVNRRGFPPDFIGSRIASRSLSSEETNSARREI